MAEKSERKSEPAAAAAAATAEAGKKGGLLSKTPVLLGGVMVIEAAVLFGGFKMLGGGAPKAAPGAELFEESSAEGHEEGHGGGHGGSTKPADKKKAVEIAILDFKAPNKVSGRTFLFDVSIYAVAKSDSEEKVRTALKDREALIKDRVRTIIAQSDPEKLLGSSEPGLETLRRQVKYQLDEIIGEGLIEEVLVPRCIPMRADY